MIYPIPIIFSFPGIGFVVQKYFINSVNGLFVCRRMLTPTTPMAVSEDTVPTPATTTTTTTMSPAFRISVTRIIKGFLTTVALAALAYWLVQVAGMQYLATLTSATLLTLLLVYIVWCLTVRKNQHHQVQYRFYSVTLLPLIFSNGRNHYLLT